VKNVTGGPVFYFRPPLAPALTEAPWPADPLVHNQVTQTKKLCKPLRLLTKGSDRTRIDRILLSFRSIAGFLAVKRMTIIYPPARPRTTAQLKTEAAHLQALPGYEAALHTYTRQISAYREASRPVAKLIANEDRYRTLNFFFTMWAEKVGAGGDGALTYSELFEICRRGEVSPRILKTTLSIGGVLGFFQRSRNPADGRSWLYRPTPQMLLFPHQWLLPAAHALDTLLPDRKRAERLEADPAILVYFFRSAGREFASGLQPMTLQPEFMSFYGQKEGGAVFTMGLLLAEIDGLPTPSRAEIAARYGLTKSQVNQLIVAGQAAGLLTVEAGMPRPTNALRDGHSEWVALSLAFLGHHLWPEAPSVAET
jgi:hypothetical protein